MGYLHVWEHGREQSESDARGVSEHTALSSNVQQILPAKDLPVTIGVTLGTRGVCVYMRVCAYVPVSAVVGRRNTGAICQTPGYLENI